MQRAHEGEFQIVGGPGAEHDVEDIGLHRDGGSTTSNTATAGTAPAWTAGTKPPSGTGTGYWPATWSRSGPWPYNQPHAKPPGASPADRQGPDLSPGPFSGRSS